MEARIGWLKVVRLKMTSDGFALPNFVALAKKLRPKMTLSDYKIHRNIVMGKFHPGGL